MQLVEREIISAEKEFGRPEGSVLIMAAVESARDFLVSHFPVVIIQKTPDTHHRNWNRAYGCKTERLNAKVIATREGDVFLGLNCYS